MRGAQAQGDGCDRVPNAGAAGRCAQNPDTPTRTRCPARHGPRGFAQGRPEKKALGPAPGGSGLLLSVPVAAGGTGESRAPAPPQKKTSLYLPSTVRLPLKTWGQHGKASPRCKKSKGGVQGLLLAGVKARGRRRGHLVTASAHPHGAHHGPDTATQGQRGCKGRRPRHATLPPSLPQVPVAHARLLRHERGE